MAEPLRNRPNDVGPLARHFAAQLARGHGVPELSLSSCAIEYLAGLESLGNLGQLRHLLEQALLCCDGPLINAGLLRMLVGHTDGRKDQ
jgi:DNA-binding NtrC family response regulator